MVDIDPKLDRQFQPLPAAPSVQSMKILPQAEISASIIGFSCDAVSLEESRRLPVGSNQEGLLAHLLQRLTKAAPTRRNRRPAFHAQTRRSCDVSYTSWLQDGGFERIGDAITALHFLPFLISLRSPTPGCCAQSSIERTDLGAWRPSTWQPRPD